MSTQRIIFILLLAWFTTVFAGNTAEVKPVVANTDKYKDWTPPPPPVTVKQTAMVSDEVAKELAEKWGVELLSLRITAADMMMDFRFRVLDVDKSSVFFDHRVKPYIYVEKSKAKLPVPMATKVGAFRPTNRGANIKANKNYYIVFGNPDRHVKPGDYVNLVFGELTIEHVPVQ